MTKRPKRGLSSLFGILGHQEQPVSAKVQPMFNVLAETESSPAEIIFYGDVFEEVPRNWWTGEPIEGMHITLQEMKDRIEEVKDASEIVIRLNSSGGDLFAGITLHNLLSGLKGKKTVRVDGLAASAASIIMCAGDTVELYPGSMVMIHNASSCLCGYYSTSEIRSILADHDAAEKSMRAIYAKKCGKTDDELQEMIDATTWMIGQEAIDEGFADALIETAYEEGGGEDPEDGDREDPVAELSADGHALMVAGIRHSLDGIANLPAIFAANKPVSIVAEATRNITADREPDAREESKEDVLEITTEAELRAAYPDLVASVAEQAVQAERQRIQGIDAIASKIGDKGMVAAAKYDDPISPETLVFNAAKDDKLVNAAFLAATEQDEDDSNVDEVDPGSATDEDDPDKKEEDEMVAAVARIRNAKGQE